MRPDVNAQFCPAANRCIVGDRLAPECGEAPDHFLPLALGESLCSRALTRGIDVQIESVEAGDFPTYDAERYATAGWLELDLALADKLAEAAKHFSRAEAYVDQAIGSSYSWFNGVFSANLLRAYLPQFRAKQAGKVMSDQEVHLVRRGLVVAFDALHAAPAHMGGSQHIIDAKDAGQEHQPCWRQEGERRGMEAKLVGMMLAARSRACLYPASEREARARGSLMAQNHDAYMVQGARKTPVKFSMKSQADATNLRGKVKYDGGLVFVNMSALANGFFEVLQASPRSSMNNAHYRALLRRNNNARPDVTQIGQLLRDEIVGKTLDSSSLFMLDGLTERLEKMLSTPKAAPSWEMLPDGLLGSNGVKESASMLAEARRAIGKYLKFAHTAPDVAEFQRLIDTARSIKSSLYVRMMCAAMYIDLARNTETNPADAVRLVNIAETMIAESTKDWRKLPASDVEVMFRAGLYRAYASKYRKALSGQTPDLDDETKLYEDLLELGNKTLGPGATLEPEDSRFGVRGVQLEIALHLLNARFNVRHGEIMQSAWPSMPREDKPRDDIYEYRTGWDVAVSTGPFLDQDLSCRYIQLKSMNRGSAYDPAIQVIAGKEDLLLQATNDVIHWALREKQGTSHLARIEAARKLDACEKRLMQLLGWDYPESS